MKGARLKRPYQIPHSHFFSEAPHRRNQSAQRPGLCSLCVFIRCCLRSTTCHVPWGKQQRLAPALGRQRSRIPQGSSIDLATLTSRRWEYDPKISQMSARSPIQGRISSKIALRNFFFNLSKVASIVRHCWGVAALPVTSSCPTGNWDPDHLAVVNIILCHLAEKQAFVLSQLEGLIIWICPCHVSHCRASTSTRNTYMLSLHHNRSRVTINNRIIQSFGRWQSIRQFHKWYASIRKFSGTYLQLLPGCSVQSTTDAVDWRIFCHGPLLGTRVPSASSTITC